MRVLLLLFLLYLTSCIKEDDPKTEIKYIPFNGNIFGSLEFNGISNTLYIKFHSDGRYDAYCKHIKGEMTRYNNAFRFDLYGVVSDDKPGYASYDTCGGAEVVFLFPHLQNGEYSFLVNPEDKVESEGKLIVSDRKFEVKMNAESPINFPFGNTIEY